MLLDVFNPSNKEEKVVNEVCGDKKPQSPIPLIRPIILDIKPLSDVIEDMCDCIVNNRMETAKIWRYIALQWIDSSEYTEREKEYYRGQLDYIMHEFIKCTG